MLVGSTGFVLRVIGVVYPTMNDCLFVVGLPEHPVLGTQNPLLLPELVSAD